MLVLAIFLDTSLFCLRKRRVVVAVQGYQHDFYTRTQCNLLFNVECYLQRCSGDNECLKNLSVTMLFQGRHLIQLQLSYYFQVFIHSRFQ